MCIKYCFEYKFCSNFFFRSKCKFNVSPKRRFPSRDLFLRKHRLSMSGVRKRLARCLIHWSWGRRSVHRRRQRLSKRRYSTPTHSRFVAQPSNGLRSFVDQTWHHVQRIQSQILQGVRNVVEKTILFYIFF